MEGKATLHPPTPKHGQPEALVNPPITSIGCGSPCAQRYQMLAREMPAPVPTTDLSYMPGSKLNNARAHLGDSPQHSQMGMLLYSGEKPKFRVLNYLF